TRSIRDWSSDVCSPDLEFHELRDKLSNIGPNSLELIHALRYREYLVSDIESDHGYWPGFFKNNRCGFRVSQDIELSSRGHIAGVVPAAHQGDSANALNQLWVHARDRKSTRLNSSHVSNSYVVFYL